MVQLLTVSQFYIRPAAYWSWPDTKLNRTDKWKMFKSYRYQRLDINQSTLSPAKITLKGTLPQNIFLIKSGHIGHINSLNIGGFNKFYKNVCQKLQFKLFVVPETMSLLYVRSKVCMTHFHVRSKVCIAPIHVRSKVCKFVPHMDGSNADFALHMEGSHADFAPHIERRHSFRGQIIANTASFANFQR